MAEVGAVHEVERGGFDALTSRAGDALTTGTARTFWPRTGTALEGGASDGGNGAAKGAGGGDGGAAKGDGDGGLPTSCTSENRATVQPPKQAGDREPRPQGEVGTGGATSFLRAERAVRATRQAGDREEHSRGEARSKPIDRSGHRHAGRNAFVIKGTVFAALVAAATGIDANIASDSHFIQCPVCRYYVDPRDMESGAHDVYFCEPPHASPESAASQGTPALPAAAPGQAEVPIVDATASEGNATVVAADSDVDDDDYGSGPVVMHRHAEGSGSNRTTTTTTTAAASPERPPSPPRPRSSWPSEAASGAAQDEGGADDRARRLMTATSSSCSPLFPTLVVLDRLDNAQELLKHIHTRQLAAWGGGDVLRIYWFCNDRLRQLRLSLSAMAEWSQ